MEEKRTNFEAWGRLTADPKPIDSKAGLLADFTLIYQPNKRFAPVYLNFTAGLGEKGQDLAEYILENFRQDDAMQVLVSTPTTRKTKSGQVFFKFLCWDVAPKQAEQASSPEDSDAPY